MMKYGDFHKCTQFHLSSISMGFSLTKLIQLLGHYEIRTFGDSRMLSTFEMSLDQGKPVLIENMGEGARAFYVGEEDSCSIKS